MVDQHIPILKTPLPTCKKINLEGTFRPGETNSRPLPSLTNKNQPSNAFLYRFRKKHPEKRDFQTCKKLDFTLYNNNTLF